VQAKSVLKVTVTSRNQEIGFVVVDLDNLRIVPFDVKGRRELILPIAHAKSRKQTGQLRVVVQLFNRPQSRASKSTSPSDPNGEVAVPVSTKLDSATVEVHGGEEINTDSYALEPSELQPSTVEYETVTTSMFLDSSQQSELSHNTDQDKSVSHAPSEKAILGDGKDVSNKSIGAGPIMSSVSNGFGSMSLVDDTLSPLHSSSNILDKSSLLLPPRSRFGFPFLSSHSVTSDTPSSQADSSLFESDYDNMSKLRATSYNDFSYAMEEESLSQAASYSSVESWSNQDQLVLTIQLVAAIDLIRAHMVKINSPTVTIGCGKKTFVLPAIEKAGNSAMWERLHLIMYMGKLTQLRLAISSKGVQIGVVVFSRNKLVEGRKNAKGLQVVFGEFLGKSNEDITGKLKIAYKLAPSTHSEAVDNPLS